MRCPCGLPAVLETYPLLDGVPFPTTYWLTCTRAAARIAELESAGAISEVNERLAEDPEFAAELVRAQADHRGRRDGLHTLLEGGGIGGGRADRVKCLHAHFAHHAVCGCNPIGAWVEARTGPLLHAPPCVDPSSAP